MSSYSFQDVYNHVCRICYPIKHERHYPHRLPGAHWNTLTFRASRRTEPTQSLQWSTSSGHTNTDHIFTAKHAKNCLYCSLLYRCHTVRNILYWFFTSSQRQSLKNGDIGPLNTLVWAKSLNISEQIYIKFVVDFPAYENGCKNGQRLKLTHYPS